MAYTIITRFLGPTNHRGSRVKASVGHDPRRSLTLDWEHALNPTLNHVLAAEQLAIREGFAGQWTMGETADSYVFVTMGAARFTTPAGDA